MDAIGKLSMLFYLEMDYFLADEKEGENGKSLRNKILLGMETYFLVMGTVA